MGGLISFKGNKMKFFWLMAIFLSLLVSACDPIERPKVLVDSPDMATMNMLIDEAMGSPYVWGQEGPDAFDCSGLVYWVYGSMNLVLPRVSAEQAKAGKEVSFAHLRYGDLIFFDTDGVFDGKITHVGIYVDSGQMVYASSIEGEVIERRLETYSFKDRIVCCRRVADIR
jgi:cell wall-associated NlpC family hydrolase